MKNNDKSANSGTYTYGQFAQEIMDMGRKDAPGSFLFMADNHTSNIKVMVQPAKGYKIELGDIDF